VRLNGVVGVQTLCGVFAALSVMQVSCGLRSADLRMTAVLGVAPRIELDAMVSAAARGVLNLMLWSSR
jgi:hypothetical protein